MSTALRLLVSDSYHAVTLQRVAREAGVSKGLVTYYFPSKDALFQETIASYHERQLTLLQGIVRSRLPVRERLELLVRSAFPSQKAVADEARFQIEVWSFAKSRPEVAQWLREHYAAFRQAGAALLQVGVEEGLVAADRPEERYAAIHAVIDGLSLQVAADPDVDIAEVRRQALDAVMALLR